MQLETLIAGRTKRGLRSSPRSRRAGRVAAFIASLGMVTPPLDASIRVAGTLGRAPIRIGGTLGADDNHGGPTTQTLGTVDDSEPVMTLDALTYTFTVTNTGSNPLTNLSLAITYDTDSTYVGCSAGTFTSASESGGVVTAAVASVAAGGTAVCTVTVTTPATAQTLSLSSSATADNASTANDTETTVVKFVTKDATSGIRCPANGTEQTDLLTCKGVVGTASLIWGLQESSGNLADGVGSKTGNKVGSPLYQQTESGWSRKGIDFDNTGWFYTVDSGLPDLASASGIMITFADIYGTQTGDKYMNYLGSSGGVHGAHIEISTASSQPYAKFDGATSTATTSHGGQVRPFVTDFNRNDSENYGLSDIQKMSVAWQTGCLGKVFELSDGLANKTRHLYSYLISNHHTLAEIKAHLQAYGWTITWSP